MSISRLLLQTFLAASILLTLNQSIASEFKGEGELGYTVNSGNTNNKNLNARLGLAYLVDSWIHSFDLSLQRVEESEVTTTDRVQFSEKSLYNFTKHDYVFGAFRYDDDKFSGFDHQTTITAGYGRRWIDSDTTLFETELGAGYKETETNTNPAVKDGNAVIRLGMKFTKKLTDTTNFSQVLLIESTSPNDFIESQTGLKVSVDKNLALKLTYVRKRNSNPPVGNGKTDSTSSVTLVYSF